MASQKTVDFFKTSFNELAIIMKNHPTPDSIKKWKAKLIPMLEGSGKIKISRIEIVRYPESTYDFSMSVDEHELKIAETVLRDMAFKHLCKKTKENIEALKILKAREENIDFEMQLSEMICGDHENFPYRSSTYLTEFFQNLGYNFVHENETRRYWVKDRLEELNIKEIHTLISTGLFRKKYFTDCIKDQNNINVSLSEAAKAFKEFIQNSITANEHFDLSGVLDMNVNIELLFDNEAKTEDIALNKLIEEAKERFLDHNDKQVALEKLWDAFERLRTHFTAEGKDKKESAIKLVDIVSQNFDKELINEEFFKLGKIGNGYRIRHHEVGKLELTPEHINYFFFRMLSLIDLCLVFLNKHEVDDVDIF